MRDRVIRRAIEILRAEGLDEPRRCLAHAAAVVCAAHAHGHRLILQAGTHRWPIGPCLDDGTYDALEYRFSPELGSMWFLNRDGTHDRLPEIHCWAADPVSMEVVDIATRWIPKNCELLGLSYRTDPPPQYFWGADAPKGSAYIADPFATAMIHVLAEESLPFPLPPETRAVAALAKQRLPEIARSISRDTA